MFNQICINEEMLPIYIYRYIYARSTKSRDYIERSSSSLVSFVIFKNAFTFDR